MLKQIVGSLFIAAGLIGCNVGEGNLKDGYQFGDLTREAVRLQDEWCTNGDPVAKLLLLKIVKELNADDICEIDIIERLTE